MGGCLWSFLPLFILIPLYYIIREPLTYLMDVPKDANCQDRRDHRHCQHRRVSSDRYG